MQHIYQYTVKNPNLNNIGYVVAIANLNDKHDRSTPSHYHWKILKCRMIIFSNSSILACPDKKDVKQVHILFNKVGDDYDKLNSLFLKFSLTQDGAIRSTTAEVFQMCFSYTLKAKIAPTWNTLGYNYLINNRDFLSTKGQQDGVQIHIESDGQLYCYTSHGWFHSSVRLTCTIQGWLSNPDLKTNFIQYCTVLHLKPVSINLIKASEDISAGEYVRVLPSLNKAVVEECAKEIPEKGSFKSFKDIRRHWKNIHGYRLPDEEGSYYMIRFWRGEPLTYPSTCVTRHFPIVTPLQRPKEEEVLLRFTSCLKTKMPSFLGVPLMMQMNESNEVSKATRTLELQSQDHPISLCTPTQNPLSSFK